MILFRDNMEIPGNEITNETATDDTIDTSSDITGKVITEVQTKQVLKS